MGSDDLKVKIEISCPVCKKRGLINIEENLVNKSTRGVTAVNVGDSLICDHSFVAYIDRNLVVRDTFVCDFKIQLPQIESELEIDSELQVDFDMDVIKLNVMPSLLVNLIKGVLAKKPVVVISDHEFLNEHYSKFYQYIFGDTFSANITFLSHQDYKKERKNYKDSLILDGINIIQDKDKIIESIKSKIVQVIVQRFFAEFDQTSGVIILKNELAKISRIIQNILSFNSTLKEGQELNSKDLINYLNNTNLTSVEFNVNTTMSSGEHITALVFDFEGNIADIYKKNDTVKITFTIQHVEFSYNEWSYDIEVYKEGWDKNYYLNNNYAQILPKSSIIHSDIIT